MTAAESTVLASTRPQIDRVVLDRAVSWPRYDAELARRGDRRLPRLAYLDGALERMSPSQEHERIKSYLGRLIEAYALEAGVDLSPYGSWTLRREPAAVGIEPDECYLVGEQGERVPDLALEVVWTAGGVDKLEIYRRLGVGEVWFWRDGRLEVFVLAEGRYERSPASRLFPGLDLALVTRLLAAPTMLQAVRGLRSALGR